MPGECHISREALEKPFGADWPSGATDVLETHRQEIVETAARLIRDGRFGEDKSIRIRRPGYLLRRPWSGAVNQEKAGRAGEIMIETISSGLLSAGAMLAALFGFLLIVEPVSGEQAPGVKWEKRKEIAAGGGYRGPWRMNESGFHYVDDPTVDIDEEGGIGVAWADQSRQDIFFQLYAPNGGKRFEKPVNVSRSPEIFSWLPRMVITSSDPSQIYILWQEIVFSGGTHGGEIFFARSTDGGKNFSQPINLSNTIAGAGKGRLSKDFWHNGSLDIAMAPQGILYAAWTEYEGALRLTRSVDGGQSFSEPMLIWGSNENPARGPSLAAGAGGSVFLAWTVGEDKSADIHFALSTDHGRSFGEPQIIAPGSGHAEAPKIAVDGNGTVHLVYAESPDGPLERYHIRYTRRAGGEGAFEKAQEIAVPAERWESMNFPSLGLDGKEGLYVVWELFPRPVSFPQGLGFTCSFDGGRTFTATAEIPGSGEASLGSGGGRQGLLMKKIAVNKAGETAVVHSTFKKDQESRIWLWRGKSSRPVSADGIGMQER